MSKKTNKRTACFRYFEVLEISKDANENEVAGRFDLRHWLKVVDERGNNNRSVELLGDHAKLETFYPSTVDDKYWHLKFSRLREYNVPTKSYTDSRESRDIEMEDDEFIGEHAYAIYNVNSNVLMLQYNRNSFTQIGVIKYINEIWKKRNGKTIDLRPVMRGVADLAHMTKQGTDYRRIVIRFADMNDAERLDKELGLKGVVEGLGEFDAPFVEISIGMGRKQGSMNRSRAKELLKRIAGNKDMMEKAEVKIIHDEIGDVLDLVADKVMCDYISFVVEPRMSLGGEFFEREMLQRFRDKNTEILAKLKRS